MIHTLSRGSRSWGPVHGTLAHRRLALGRLVMPLAWLFLVPAAGNTTWVQAQETSPPVETTPTKLIDFNRDVRPILESNCIECHGPEEAKEGFRVDEQDTLLSYIEPGDVSASAIWTDYLLSADEEMRMPPVNQNKPLTGAQLATLKLWIEEGAVWAAPTAVAKITPPPAKSQFQRVTTFLGLFHPAAVHFPVALLMISAFFLVCSFAYRDAFESAAFHCLWIGAISACASCLLGWFFTESQGYSSIPTFDFSKGIERHRWTAVTLSVLSIAIIPIAISARRNPDNRKRRVIWLVGASLLALLVSIAGHQGGELVYGEDLYTPAFNAIFEKPPQE
jgi:uncharacterized membrane protein/mono/diheme cytochrome c family protein